MVMILKISNGHNRGCIYYIFNIISVIHKILELIDSNWDHPYLFQRNFPALVHNWNFYIDFSEHKHSNAEVQNLNKQSIKEINTVVAIMNPKYNSNSDSLAEYIDIL